MNKYIDNFKLNGDLVAVYSDIENTERFSVGYIEQTDDMTFLLRRISPHGEYDGYTVKQIQSTFLIETETPYLSTLLAPVVAEDAIAPICYKDNAVETLLYYAREKQLRCEIELANSGVVDVIGYVVDITDMYLLVQQVDENDIDRGKAVINLAYISELNCDEEARSKKH